MAPITTAKTSERVRSSALQHSVCAMPVICGPRPTRTGFTCLPVLQPLDIAKLQAKVIEHDQEKMYEVLEGFTWQHEKVRSTLLRGMAFVRDNAVNR